MVSAIRIWDAVIAGKGVSASFRPFPVTKPGFSYLLASQDIPWPPFATVVMLPPLFEIVCRGRLVPAEDVEHRGCSEEKSAYLSSTS